MDARSIAASWTRPYTSVQWAWVRALGVGPSTRWADEGGHQATRHHRGLGRLMRQRHGVRGL